MRLLTYSLCVLDAAIALIIMFALLSGIPDPATTSLDRLAGYAVFALCLVTAGPALAMTPRAPKAALMLAASFPLLLALLVAAAAMLI